LNRKYSAYASCLSHSTIEWQSTRFPRPVTRGPIFGRDNDERCSKQGRFILNVLRKLDAPVTDADLVEALTKAKLPTKAANGAHFYKHRTLLKQGWCERV
jgi:hypothetical protein